MISELIDSTDRRWAVSAPQPWPVIMTSGRHNVHGSWWQLLLEHCLKRHCVGGLGYSFRYDVPNPDGPWEKAVLIYVKVLMGEGELGSVTASGTWGVWREIVRDVAGCLTIYCNALWNKASRETNRLSCSDLHWRSCRSALTLVCTSTVLSCDKPCRFTLHRLKLANMASLKRVPYTARILKGWSD